MQFKNNCKIYNLDLYFYDRDMAAKKHTVRNPKSFIFNQIFLSGATKEIIHALEKNTKFENPVLKVFPSKMFNKLDKGYIAKAKFHGTIQSTILVYYPKSFLKRYNIRKQKAAYDFTSVFTENTSKVFNILFDNFTDWEITEFAKFKQKNRMTRSKILLKVEFPVLNKRIKSYFSIFLTRAFISKLETRFIGKKSSAKGLLDRILTLDEYFTEFVKKKNLNKKEILKSKLSDKHSFTTDFIEFNELIKLKDAEIRILLEELINRRFSDRDLVLALSSSSDELRKKFLQNMSKNRRKELAQEFYILEGKTDEKLRVQREVLYVLVDMINKKRLHFEKEIAEKLLQLSAKLKKEASREAEKYLNSGEFFSLISNLNNRQIQLLIRRVNRKTLILGLLGGNTEIKRHFVVNMNDEMLSMVKEDVNYWKKQIPEPEEMWIYSADAQKAMVQKGKIIIEEDKKIININFSK